MVCVLIARVPKAKLSKCLNQAKTHSHTATNEFLSTSIKGLCVTAQPEQQDKLHIYPHSHLAVSLLKHISLLSGQCCPFRSLKHNIFNRQRQAHEWTSRDVITDISTFLKYQKAAETCLNTRLNYAGCRHPLMSLMGCDSHVISW